MCENANIVNRTLHTLYAQVFVDSSKRRPPPPFTKFTFESAACAYKSEKSDLTRIALDLKRYSHCSTSTWPRNKRTRHHLNIFG